MIISQILKKSCDLTKLDEYPFQSHQLTYIYILG